LAVARPSGSVEAFPRLGDLTAFRIPHGVLVRLHAGTWHAGPLFDGGFALGEPPVDTDEACKRAMERAGVVGVPSPAAAGQQGEGGASATANPSPPLFLDFFNLELSDTNVVDHNTHDYAVSGDGEKASGGVAFEVVDG
jgi:hypothetical protein